MEPDTGSEPTQAVEDWSLEELLGVVVSATHTTLRVQEAPSIVAVVTRDEIRRRGYLSVADALRHVPGLHVIDDHVYQNVGVRGVFAAPSSANDTIRVLINGQPVSFRATNVSFLGEDLIPIEAVERIEIIRGPASALYGANAFLGVINVVTSDGTAEALGTGARHVATVDGWILQNPRETTLNGRVSLLSTGAFGPLSYLAAASFRRADRSGLTVPGLDDLVKDDAWRLDPERFSAPRGYPTPGWNAFDRSYLERVAVSRNDLEYATSAYGNLGYALSDETTLRLDGRLGYSERGAQWQSFSALAPRSRLTHLNGFGRLSLDYREEASEGVAFKGSVALASGAPTERERIVDRLVETSLRRRDMGFLSFDAYARGRYSFGRRDSLSLGFDYTRDRHDLASVETVAGGESSFTDDFEDRTFSNFGVFGQWLWNPVSALTVTLGARLDYNTQIACDGGEWDCLGSRPARQVEVGEEEVTISNRGLFQLSSRVGLVYALPVDGLYAKLIYGSSFKPPSPYQLYHRPLTTEGADVGSPLLRPQTADTVELAVGLDRDDGVEASAVLFVSAVDNLVVYFQEGGALAPRNARAELAGIEGEVRYRSQGGWSTFAAFEWLAYSAISPEQRRDETDFLWENSELNGTTAAARYPTWTARGGVNLELPEHYLNINLAAVVVGPRNASLSNNQLFDRVDVESTYAFDPYLTADLTISTVGLELIPARESRFRLSMRGVPGPAAEAGVGGLDVPTLGSRFLLGYQQEL